MSDTFTTTDGTIDPEANGAKLPEKMVYLQPGYTTPPEFKNIPFNEAWLTLDDMPFGLEDWALEFMQPGDFGTGTRFHANTSPNEPWTTTFRVKREHNGDVDIQFEVSSDEFFSLKPNGAILFRRGRDGHGALSMAKWMPMLHVNNVRHWRKLWERKIVRENVAPLTPATNGAALEFLKDNVYRLAMHYNIPPAKVEGVDNSYFFYNWVRDSLPTEKKLRDAMYKDTRPVDNHLFRLVVDFHDMELRLRTNARDLTPIQILAEFQAYSFKTKSVLGLQVAQGLSVRSLTK